MNKRLYTSSGVYLTLLFFVASWTVLAVPDDGEETGDSHFHGIVLSSDVQAGRFTVEAEAGDQDDDEDGEDDEEDEDALAGSLVVVLVDEETVFAGAPAAGLPTLREGDGVEVRGTSFGEREVLARDVEVKSMTPEEEGDDDCAEQPVARFFLDDVSVSRGDQVEVPFRVTSGRSLSLVSLSVEYDTRALEFIAPRLSAEASALLEGRDPETHVSWWSNPEDGWLQVSVVFDYQGRETLSFPGEGTCCLAYLGFRAVPDADEGTSSLVLTKAANARYEGNFHSSVAPVYNVARGSGEPFFADVEFEEAEDACTLDGSVVISSIIGDIGIFKRGDVNLDRQIDLGDPIFLLSSLFGTADLKCPDVADTNGDGGLDLSDAVLILLYLFDGASAWAPTDVRTDPGCGL